MSILLLTAVLAFRYKRFEMSIDKKEIHIRSGFLLVRRTVIPIKSISTVEILRFPTDRIFSAISVRINTEAAGRSGNYRFVLAKRDEERLLRSLKINVCGEETRFSFKQIMIFVAAKSSVVNGVLLTVPLLNRAGALVGAELSEIIISEIDNLGHKLPHYSPAINTLSLVFLFFYLCALFFYLAVYLKFGVVHGKEYIKTAYGIVTHRTVYIRKTLTGGYLAAQTPLMLAFGRGFIKADVTHSKRHNTRYALLVPDAEMQSLEKQFERLDLTKQNRLHARPTDYYRFFKVPFYIFSASTITMLTLTQKEPMFREVFLLFYCICIGYTFLSAVYAAHNCRNNATCFGKVVQVHGSKGYELYDAYFFADKTGEIKIWRFPLDIKNKTCSAKITLRTENALSAKARFVSYDGFMAQINKVYNLSE